MPKNHPKIYTKSPNSGYWNVHGDLALFETWARFWQKGRVKRRQNNLHVYPRLKSGDVNLALLFSWGTRILHWSFLQSINTNLFDSFPLRVK